MHSTAIYYVFLQLNNIGHTYNGNVHTKKSENRLKNGLIKIHYNKEGIDEYLGYYILTCLHTDVRNTVIEVRMPFFYISKKHL